MIYAKLNAVGAVTHIDQITTQQGCTLKQVVEDALREFFSHHRLERDPVKLETVSGAGLKPGVNLDDERSLNDIMDGR